MTTMLLTLDTIDNYLVHSITNLCNAGTLLIERHDMERNRNSKKSAASYLRAALTVVRQMVRHAPHYPILWESALALLDQVCEAMDVAEQQLFREGGNTAGYATVLAQAEGLRLQIVEQYRQELTDRAREVDADADVVEVHVASPPPALDRRRTVLRPKMPRATFPPFHEDDADVDEDFDDDDNDPFAAYDPSHHAPPPEGQRR